MYISLLAYGDQEKILASHLAGTSWEIKGHEQGFERSRAGCGELTGTGKSSAGHSFALEAKASEKSETSVKPGMSWGHRAVGEQRVVAKSAEEQAEVLDSAGQPAVGMAKGLGGAGPLQQNKWNRGLGPLSYGCCLFH